MSSTQFKLTKDGGLTRRLTLPDRPSWLSLATRIESLFSVPFEKVAVAYDDADGDEVTLSSQDELLDFYSNVHRPGESVKFKVIDLSSLRSGRGGSAAGDESSTTLSSVQDAFGGGLGNMGPTMVIDVDDWDRLPTLPNLRLFGMSDESSSEPHAFVEVVESDVGSKTGGGSERLTSAASTTKDKGKGKGKSVDATSSIPPNTSEASVVEDDAPDKPNVHIYDVSQAGNMSPRSLAAATPRLYALNLDEPRYSAFGGARTSTRPSDARSQSDSISTVTTTPASPYEDGKPLPKTPSVRSAAPPRHPVTMLSSNSTPRPIPVTVESATTDRAPEQAAADDSTPSFVSDVANLVEAMTAAFSAHPELSEGLRNIVANSVNGNYWATDRDTILSAANNMRKTAEEMSDHASRFSQNVAQNAENDAIRRIAESLGGVFRTIGDLTSGAGAGMSNGAPHTEPVPAAAPMGQATSMPGSWPHPSEWRRPGQNPFTGRALPNQYSNGPYPPQGYRSFSAGSYMPNQYSSPMNAPGMTVVDDSSVPPQNRQLPVRFRERVLSTPQRSNTWTGGRSPYGPPGNYAEPYYLTEQTLGNHNEFHNVHESKAQLEAAKAFYRAEKERFKKEKEERRRSRRENAERRAEEGRASNPNEIREETVVARIPLSSPKGPGASRKGPYVEIYSVSSPEKPAISSVPLNGRPTAPMMFDKVVSRLSDMGFTTTSHPNLLTVVNEQLYPNGQPTKLNEEEILTKALGALRIRGTPSPRPSPRASGSGLQLH